MAYGDVPGMGFLLHGWIDYNAVANFQDSFYKWGRTFLKFLKTTAFENNRLYCNNFDPTLLWQTPYLFR